jgi:hypothetical protein
MRHNDPDAERGTDPRPRHILLGRDAEGAHHVYATRADTVTVVDPARGERHVVESLDGDPLGDWMAYVEARRGWADRRYYDDAMKALVADLADATNGGAA